MPPPSWANPASGDWRDLDVAALRGRLIVDGHQRDEGVGADLMGHPLNCLAWLAGSSVAEAFGGLKAGQVVMLGSVTPPIWLTGAGHRDGRVPAVAAGAGDADLDAGFIGVSLVKRRGFW